MADVTFAGVKVHNELEFCEVTDMETKKQLERLFLSERISYFEKWDNQSFLKRLFSSTDKNRCILCINEMQKEKADLVLENHPEIASKIERINKRVEKTYF